MKKVKKDGKRKKVKAVKGPDFVKMLRANLADPVSRAAVNRAEELYCDISSPKKRSLRGFTLPPADQLAAIIALIMSFLTPKPQPAPAPVPTPAPGPGPTPPPPVPAPATGHRIVGGKAKITGLTEGGPLGKRWGGAALAAVLNGTGNAPHDSRFEFDFTPTFEDGHVGTADDPYFLMTPLCPKGPGDTDGPMQQARLRFDYEGAGSADLAHEYANYGCSPRIRARTGGGDGGLLSNLRFEFDGGSVAVEGVDQIHVGRGA